MSISQTQIKGTVVLNSDAGANLTIGNSTATNAITGTTNINTSGTSNTTIGNTSVGGITTLSSNIISMKSTTSAVGKIDIMAGDSSTGDVNILTGAFSTGIIDIGGDSTTTNIKGGSVNIETTDDSSSTVNIMTGVDAIGTITIGNTTGANDSTTALNGKTTVSKLFSLSMDSPLATTNQTIGNNLTTGNLSIASGNLTTGILTIGRAGNTFANASRIVTGAFKNIEDNICSEFGGRIYKQILGVHTSVSQATEQTCYASILGANYNVPVPFFQFDLPAGTQYTTQLFNITVVGWVDAISTFVFNGNFLCGINAANTNCFTTGTGSNPFQTGFNVGSSVSVFTFTLAVNRVTINYTQPQTGTGQSNLTAKVMSNIGRPGNQFMITPLC